jgi:hypothetical protein
MATLVSHSRATNAAVFPTVQAQELAHPQLAEKYPVEIGAALSIPNEEVQFEAITVIDDSGQEHKIEGGSPLGTVIRDFSRVGRKGYSRSCFGRFWQ